MPTASKRLAMVLLDSSIAMMPLPAATIAWAVSASCSMLMCRVVSRIGWQPERGGIIAALRVSRCFSRDPGAPGRGDSHRAAWSGQSRLQAPARPRSEAVNGAQPDPAVEEVEIAVEVGLAAVGADLARRVVERESPALPGKPLDAEAAEPYIGIDAAGIGGEPPGIGRQAPVGIAGRHPAPAAAQARHRQIRGDLPALAVADH